MPMKEKQRHLDEVGGRESMDHILTVEPPNFSCTSMLTVTQEAIVPLGSVF